MSLLDTLNANGVTAEDLEKAASVRLFEKAAHSESNFSTELRNHVDAPFNNSTNLNTEIYPMDYIDLFEKQASDEGIDLDMLDDHELAELYNHFIDEVAYADDEGYYDDEEYFDEDYEKLAEAELLGEVMADAYLNKLAAAPDGYSYAQAKKHGKNFVEGAKALEAGFSTGLGKMVTRGGKGFGSLGALQDRIAKANPTMKRNSKAFRNLVSQALKTRGRITAGVGAAGMGAGAYALAKKRREKNAAAADGYSYDQAKKHGKKFLEGAKATEAAFSTGLGKFVTRGGKGFGSLGALQDRIAKANPTMKRNSKAFRNLVSQALKTRGRITAGVGAAGAAAGGYALKKRMDKKASLIEELALEKAASWIDGDFEIHEIDELSDELAAEILWDEGYDF